MPSLNTYTQISPQQKLDFLKKLFAKLKKEHILNEQDKGFFIQIEQVLTQYKQRSYQQADLQDTLKSIKEIIETIESTNRESSLLRIFHKQGIYRMFYHQSVTKGVDDTGALRPLLKNGFIGVGISALAIILFTTTALLGAPVWINVISNTLFSSAITYLGALVYGVVNDLFATKANLPYFLLGHQPQQASLLRTNDPTAQGIAWGMAATFGPAVLAAIAFGIGTAITASFVPVATFIFPILFIAMPLTAWAADRYAKRKAKQYEQHGHEFYGDLSDTVLGSNPYQYHGLKVMAAHKADKAAWLAISDRNLFGFTKVPFIGLGTLAAVITLSAVHLYLPTILFSTVLATAMPVAFAVAAVVFLAAAGTYMYMNRNKQIDNRFKLAFQPNAKLTHELYLDDDLTLVAEFSEDFNSSPSLDESIKEPGHFDSPLTTARKQIAQDVEYTHENKAIMPVF
jgi:hypothetical protein